jgi:hypothetical protein
MTEADVLLNLQPVVQEDPPPVNGHVPDRPAGSALSPALRRQPVPAVAADDAIINRFEALLVHGPKNIKFLTTLAEAYARKRMFDQSLSFYQQALTIAGGKNAGIEEAIAETTLKKFDLELSRVDAQAPEAAALRERIQNQRLEYQWHEMEEAH